MYHPLHNQSEITYRPSDLQNIFPKLQVQKEFALIPLMDEFIDSFISYLSENTLKLGISDWNYSRIYSDRKPFRDFCFAIDGKIVVASFEYKNMIDFKKSKQMELPRIAFITFKGLESGITYFSHLFSKFIHNQNLEEMIEKTRHALEIDLSYKTVQNPKDYLIDPVSEIYFPD